MNDEKYKRTQEKKKNQKFVQQEIELHTQISGSMNLDNENTNSLLKDKL